MVASARVGGLLGRHRELAVLERLLDGARDGHGAVLVVHGDPGVGKTALLEHAVDAATDFRVVRTAGVEGEEELDYAALQQLCAPLLDLGEDLPDPQRVALDVAFGRSAGQRPSPFLVGLAALSLLSDAAEQQPLVCVVDDAQWLDGASARALAFVARRLLAERIVLVFATRDPGGGVARVPQLRGEPSSSPVASACRRRCRSPPGSSRASGGGWRGSRPTRGGCCSWRRRSRSATRPFSGARPNGLESRRRPPARSSRRAS